MKPWPLLLLAACTSAQHSERASSASSTVATVAAAEAHTTTVRTGGAVDWRVETWEYVPVSAVETPPQGHGVAGGSATTRLPGGAELQRHSDGGAQRGAKPASPPGTLLRHSVATAHIAPVAVASTSAARSLTQTHAQATEAATEHRASDVRVGPPGWAWWVVPAVLLAVALGALWLWRRWG